jgi:hypothetical protein
LPLKTNSSPKRNSPDAFSEDKLPPEDELLTKDEFCRCIEDEFPRRTPQRRIALRRRTPPRRRIPQRSPKTNCSLNTNSPRRRIPQMHSPKTNCSSKTDSSLKTNSDAMF